MAGKKKVAKAKHGVGIGALAKELIKGGATNEEAFAAVKKKFPAGSTTLANVAWYRNDMRKKGVKGVKAQSAVKKAAAKKAA